MQSPRSVVWSPSDRYSPELEKSLRAALTRLPWALGSAAFSEGILEISGWALPPEDGQTVTFTLNGRQFDEVTLSRPNPGVDNPFWYWPNSDQSGFMCRTAVQLEDLFRTGHAVIEYVDARTLKALYEFHSFYWPRNLWTIGDLPPDKNITRVAGHSQGLQFVQGGYTTFIKLKRALEQSAGRWPQGNTLDWGCGCGRVTRWLIDERFSDVHVFGADIDGVNIDWCADHLPSGRFSTIPLHPPTQYSEGQFTAIFGMSVFTHLPEDVQLEWLRELQRIAAPGAILLMSVHGDASVCQSAPAEKWLRHWKAAGFDATQLDPALAEVIEDKEYYRAAFHTRDYIRRQWSEYFEIVEIIDAFMSNHQDLVVLRRR